MPKMNVQKSIVINAPVADVYAKVTNFNHWRAWSPWLIMEPEATLDIEADGKAYAWQGDLVGAGEMRISSEDEPIRVDMDLTFLKPFKSKAKVWFTFDAMSENGSEATKVTWHMDSSMPFFLFFMTRMMVTLIGMDYDRGLRMLKDYIEAGDVPCKLERQAGREYPGCDYVGITGDCSLSNIGEVVSEDLGKLGDWLASKSIGAAGMPFSQYHKWELAKGRTQYTVGVPVKEVPADLPAGFKAGKIPAAKAYVVKNTGPYRHLGNAWSLGQNLMRSKVFRSNKKIHPFELYVSDPGATQDNDLVTEIYFPMR